MSEIDEELMRRIVREEVTALLGGKMAVAMFAENLRRQALPGCIPADLKNLDERRQWEQGLLDSEEG